MRTLFLTADAPVNGGSGGQIVSWRLIRCYAELGDVDVIALTPADAAPSADLREITAAVRFVPVSGFHAAGARARTAARLGRALLLQSPFRIEKFRSRAMAAAVQRASTTGDYDVVHCDHLSLAQYRVHAADTPAILCEHNVEWQQFSRIAHLVRNPVVARALRADSRRTAQWEASVLDRFGRVLCLSSHDRGLLVQARPDLGARLVVWPVPTDVISAHRTPSHALKVVVLGSLRSFGRLHGLRWFVSEVWRPLREAVPEATLEIVGAAPPADIERLNGTDGIQVHGYVSDLDSVLESASVCAIPLFAGGGVRIKVLEMLSRAIPCVGTPVALQGLEDLAGCTVVRSRDEWLTALTDAAANPEEPQQAAAMGQRVVRDRHSMQRATDVLEKAVGAAMAEFPSTSYR